MRTPRTAAKKSTRKTLKADNKTDLATTAAQAITEAIARATKSGSGKDQHAKIAVHVHIGDVIMMGFDEAVDAEEWGMRENNTEIVEGSNKRGGKSVAKDADAQSEKDKKIYRNIKFKKGNLVLDATENSEPATKKRTQAAKSNKPRTAAKKRTAKR